MTVVKRWWFADIVCSTICWQRQIDTTGKTTEGVGQVNIHSGQLGSVQNDKKTQPSHFQFSLSRIQPFKAVAVFEPSSLHQTNPEPGRFSRHLHTWISKVPGLNKVPNVSIVLNHELEGNNLFSLNSRNHDYKTETNNLPA